MDSSTIKKSPMLKRIASWKNLSNLWNSDSKYTLSFSSSLSKRFIQGRKNSCATAYCISKHSERKIASLSTQQAASLVGFLNTHTHKTPFPQKHSCAHEHTHKRQENILLTVLKKTKKYWASSDCKMNLKSLLQQKKAEISCGTVKPVEECC